MDCAAHPGQRPVDACAVCGLWWCADCLEPVVGQPWCFRCRASMGVPPPRPLERHRWARLLLLFALASLAGFLSYRGLRPAPSRASCVAPALAAMGEVALQLEALRANGKDWPPSLRGVEGVTDPVDPCDPTRRPLRYGPGRYGGDALLLWSVGEDGIDDGAAPRDPGTRRGDLRYPLR